MNPISTSELSGPRVLWAINGVSCAGKSTAQDCLHEHRGVEPLGKYLTRPRRPGETGPDKFVTRETVLARRAESGFCVYTKGADLCAVSLGDVKAAMLHSPTASLILSQGSAIDYVREWLRQHGIMTVVLNLTVTQADRVKFAATSGESVDAAARRIARDHIIARGAPSGWEDTVANSGSLAEFQAAVLETFDQRMATIGASKLSA